MSERDLQRIEVLTEVLAGRRTTASGGNSAGGKRTADATIADAIPQWWWRSHHPQGSGTRVELLRV
jgi:hypothetical protein